MPNANALIRKTRRAAQSIVGGDRLLGKLTSPAYVREMENGVEENVPPVSKISHLLQEHFTSEPDIAALPVRQFIGMAVRAILAEKGYEVEERGVRISGDPVFRSGSTYRLVTKDDEEEEDLLVRFVGMLTKDELRRLQDLVKAAL
jgi:hypothetical protein